MAQKQTQALLRQRLLNDIAELQEKPYPGVTLHTQDATALQEACLILQPEGEASLHLTITFTTNYPISPPVISIQSAVSHPNVFDSWICCSLLNKSEDYTPAFTLKAICIQMLSFFASDQIDQMHGENGGKVDRQAWRTKGLNGYREDVEEDSFCCSLCGFKASPATGSNSIAIVDRMDLDYEQHHTSDRTSHLMASTTYQGITDLPNEVLLLICDELDEEDLLLAAKAWNGFGRVIRQYNVIRTRNLQCFTLKKNFKKVSLGVGVQAEWKSIQSEFDLISHEAFFKLDVRRSVQGLPFNHWLPLPISRRHWKGVRKDVLGALNDMNFSGAKSPAVNVLYNFMNEIVVRLSKEAASAEMSPPGFVRSYRYGTIDEAPKSTLRHASEKAIESYFHLYHLLLCLAVEQPTIVTEANRIVQGFVDGKRDKQSCPNLGYMLIMVLISDVEMTEDLLTDIVKETVVRNVVWMLDARGAGLADLSFMETDAESEYRLHHSFQAGKTSYRLLMFANLMRRCVSSPTTDGKRKTLVEMRDELFIRHGGPPNGAAAKLAKSVREIQKVNSFPQFLKSMNIKIPTKSEFTAFLRRSVEDSMQKGYSRWGLTQAEALNLRLRKEPKVGRASGMHASQVVNAYYSFFPGKQKGGRR